MGIVLRVFLAIIAIGVFAMIVRKVRTSQMEASDSIFWFLFGACFVVFAIVPQVAYFFSNLLGFQSPSNFIFLFAIGVLLIKCFSLSVKHASLRMKVNELAQQVALSEAPGNSEDAEPDDAGAAGEGE